MKKVKQPGFVSRINLATNEIRTVGRYCLNDMSQLVHLNLSFNKIHILESQCFTGPSELRFLDLAWNHLSYLKNNVFQHSGRIHLLNLTHNKLFTVSKKAFLMSSIDIIFTDSYKVCCIIHNSKTPCKAQPKWPMSCSRLLSDTFAGIMIWTISVIGSFLNASSLIYNGLTLRKPDIKQTKQNYAKVIILLAIGDLLLCVSLLVIASVDAYYSIDYLEGEHHWRANIMCFFVSGMGMVSNLISVFAIHMLAVLRYLLVKSPFFASTMEDKFIHLPIIIAVLLISFLSCSLMLIYGFSIESRQMPTGLCLLLGNIDKSVIPLLVSIIILISQSASVFSIPIIYLCLHIEKNKSREAVANTNTSGKMDEKVTRSLFVSQTNILGWAPSSVLLILTLIWHEYPYRIFIYMTILIFPINTIINPFIFTSSKTFKNKCSGSLRVTQQVQKT